MAAPRRIQACLNGARPRGFHPRLPLTAAELAADAAACTAAGAVAVHLHPRDAAGRESLAPEVIGAAVAAIRAAAPGLPVSVSTGAWIEGDDARQLACIRGWGTLPDRPDEASVNLAESNATAVIAALGEAGIGVEAGLAGLDDADRLLRLVPLPHLRRVLVEIDDLPPAEAEALADAVMARLGVPCVEVQLHGAGRSAWPLARRAAALGLMLRLGLEDLDAMPDGSRAADNAALVAAGLAL